MTQFFGQDDEYKSVVAATLTRKITRLEARSFFCNPKRRMQLQHYEELLHTLKVANEKAIIVKTTMEKFG